MKAQSEIVTTEVNRFLSVSIMVVYLMLQLDLNLLSAILLFPLIHFSVLGKVNILLRDKMKR